MRTIEERGLERGMEITWWCVHRCFVGFLLFFSKFMCVDSVACFDKVLFWSHNFHVLMERLAMLFTR